MPAKKRCYVGELAKANCLAESANLLGRCHGKARAQILARL
jgi:hypothetical protein